MTHINHVPPVRRAPVRRLARIVSGAALAVALGCTGVSLVTAAPVPALAQPSEAPANMHLQGQWTFDDADAPTANTADGSSLSLTLEGAEVVPSHITSLGNTLRFDGNSADPNVRVPASINSQGDYSISLWIKPDAGANMSRNTSILQTAGDNGRALLFQRADGKLATYLAGDEHIFEVVNPGRGEWHHVTLTKEGGNAKCYRLYIDGKPAGQGTWTGNLPAGTLDLLVGEHKDPTNMDRFQGKIDELCVFGTALTAEQAKANYERYDTAPGEVPAANAKETLEDLIAKGQALAAEGDDRDAYEQLDAAILAAEEAMKGTDLDALKAATSDLEQAIGAVFALGVVVDVDPNPQTDVPTIDDGIFGINHRYAFNGYGSFDPVAGEVREDFANQYAEANFGSIRYPGGTISNLFNWKETLGPRKDRTKQIHGFYNNPNQGGIAPNFGISEIATFADEQGSEIIYVYALGRGDALDAADLVEFLNGDVDHDVNGGTNWAEVRAENGHPEPYNVRYFEIGNEMQQAHPGAQGEGTADQAYWTNSVLQNPDGSATGAKKSPLNAYIDGGTVSRYQEYAVVRGNWNKTVSISNGEADQEFGMRYALVPRDGRDAITRGTDSVMTVDAQTDAKVHDWVRVDNFESSGPEDLHYVIDYATGFITFGDGEHGKIPEQGTRVKVSYKVERDGFIKISESMRDTMDLINADRASRGEEPGEIHIYSSFESNEFFTAMNTRNANDLYDGMAIHPYTFGTWSNDMSSEAFYLQAMKLGDNQINHVKSMTERMRTVSGDPTKVPVISEYGIYPSKHTMVRSQAHALYIARQIMEFIKLGSPYIQKHCLVDWYSSGGDSLGPTQQAVIQAVYEDPSQTATGEGNFTFFMTPSAYVFKLYNGTDDDRGFGTHILPTTVGDAGTLSNGVKFYDALASKDDEGNIYLAITNLDMEKAGGVTLRIAGEDLTGRTIEVRSLSGESISAENTPDNKTAVQDSTTSFVSTEASPNIPLEPHSFTIVKVPAKKAPAVHTVSFTVDGQQWGTPQEVIDGACATAPANPSKDGHRFVGWTLDGAPFDFTTPVKGDLELVAAFEKIDEPAPPTEGPDTDKPGGDKPDTDKPDTDKPGTDKPGGDKPSADKPGADKPDTDKPGAGKPGGDGELPQTGDPVLIVTVTALAGTGLALGGTALRRRR